MKRFDRFMFTLLLTVTVLAFAGQSALAGPGCKGLTDGKSCAVKSCDAKATCTTTQTTAATETKLACCADGKKCTKEECIKKCLEMGMTQEQAAECWAKHETTGATGCMAGTKLTKEECLKKCAEMGVTAEQAEACWTKHQQEAATVTTASATTGCPMMAKAAATESCTKEQCVAALMATGLSKEEAEAKHAACMVDGKCTGKCGGTAGGCAKLGTTK